ncbi:hypothetical protein L1049_003422 [Liquidambar formosana]|uniref:AAA+ ATPase domain-containing protein n=1 Tax=Liquidambar formosana TaxID=63359 RepID=A0AAP0N3F4_LIQFO
MGKLEEKIGEDLLEKLEDNIEDFMTQIENLKNIQDELQGLVDAAEKNGEVVLPKVQEWLARVNEIIEESGKLFDEELNENLKLRYQRRRYAKEKTTVFDQLKQKGSSFDGVSNFESRKLILLRIMKALKDDRVNVVGIYGMGGVGKTTLAKEVAKQAKDDKLFDEVVMVAVGSNPDFRRVRSEIAEVLRCFERLEKKKIILVILDDNWDKVDLEAIVPFGAKDKGCKIVLTSRSQEVFNQMGTQKNFSIEILSKQEGWNLFRKTSDIKPLAVKIVQACAGLPIAIVTVARALKGKRLGHQRRDAANQLRKSKPCEIVKSSLELNYKHLKSEEAKSFFLLCCLFPENWNIGIQEIMKYGMGGGFFQDVGTVVDEARERAHALAHSLKSSCLLQDGSNEDHVKMHDVIRGVALEIASKGKHVFLVRTGRGWNKFPKMNTCEEYNAMSLMSDDIHKLPNELKCPELQILLFRCPNRSLEFPNNFFLGMKNLRVLDMSGREFCWLPPSLRHLKNLRTLILDCCILGYISVVGELKKLEILSFLGSSIKKFPQEIKMLTHLKLLDLSPSELEGIIPPSVIGALSQLEELYMEGSFNDWQMEGRVYRTSRASLVELKHLSRLNNLEIHISHGNLVSEDFLCENLSRFKISVLTKFEGLDQFLYSKILKLQLSVSLCLKDGVKCMLKKAEYLHLISITGLKSVVYDLDGEGFQNLRPLIVQECRELEYIFNESEGALPGAFPVLEKLNLYNLPKLEEICHGHLPSGFFCEVQELRLRDLPRLTNMWEDPAQHICLGNLTAVVVGECHGLKNLFSQSEAKQLSQLIKLEVYCCLTMEEIVENGNEEVGDIAFPQLRFLELRGLPNARSFCSKMKCLAMQGDLNTHTREPFFDKKVSFTNLEDSKIMDIENLEEIFQSQLRHGSFSQLRTLKVTGCHNLSRVAPSNLLPRLKNLKELVVEGCSSMEKIFELEGERRLTTISLFRLKVVELRNLPNLMIFFSENYNFELPALNKLSLEGCPKMQTFSSGLVSTPKLETIDVEEDEKMWKGDLNRTIHHLFQKKG